LLRAVCDISGDSVPVHLAGRLAQNGDSSTLAAIAQQLCSDTCVMVIGQSAIAHRNYGMIEALADAVSNVSGCALCILPPANSVACSAAGCLPYRIAADGADQPHAHGLDARRMMLAPRLGYMLYDVEPCLDMADGATAKWALQQAQFVVSFQAFADIPDYVDIALPIAPFTENSGTFINCEGTVQQANAAVEPFGQARPGWKVLRVLGNFLQLAGFDQISIDQVREQAFAGKSSAGARASEGDGASCSEPASVEPDCLELMCDHSIYAIDSVVRRAPALQQTADALRAEAHINPADIQRLGLSDGDSITMSGEFFNSNTRAIADPRVAIGCLYMPGGVVALPPSGTVVRVTQVNGS